MSRVILDLCGGTGAWSLPYREAGYDVRLITLPEHDVRSYKPPEHVHGIMAAPPCTEFAVSGARWWSGKRPEALEDALAIVDACLHIIHKSKPKWWALENPIGRLRELRRRSLGTPHWSFNPCDYGDPWTKRTLLWGHFEIPLITNWHYCQHEFWGWRELGGRSERTKQLRSETPAGFARAFFKANP